MSKKKARKKFRRNASNDFQLVATPYDTSAPFWYFSSMEEFEKKFSKHLPVEEYEIAFIDGSDFELELFKAMDVTAASLEKYFEKIDEIADMDDQQLAALHFVTHYRGIEDLDDALEKAQETTVIEGDAEDYAYYFVESMGGLDQLGRETLESHFDYESFGRDLGFDLDSEDPDYERQMEMSDRERGEEFVDNNGIDILFEKPRNRRDSPLGEMYFDFESFGNDLQVGGDITEFRWKDRTWTASNY